MSIKYILPLLFFPFCNQAQTLNQGTLFIGPESQVSTYFDFKNQETGNVLNDGSLHFFANYENNGLFSFSTNATTGYVLFEGLANMPQEISGNSHSFFFDVLYDNKSGFNLSNEITTQGTVNLFDGVVMVDEQQEGAFIFLKGSNHINTSDKSHVNGEVRKEGNESFSYPIGKEGFYRMASISAPASESDLYTGEYMLDDNNPIYDAASKTKIIDKIDNKEYWIINKKSESNSNVVVALTWDERTTPDFLLGDNAERLQVVRWDDQKQVWYNEGGFVDLASKSVTTISGVNGYGIFTLATVKVDHVNPGQVVIYDGVTPNGDGLNDYFIIDNIWLYPNNKVTIFNRWGREVFKTENYDSNGNVFNGYAQGKGVVNSSEKLPSGTYYYIVEYLYTNDGTDQWIKKAGYIHLEL